MKRIVIDRPMRIMLISLGILFGAIFLFKVIVGLIIKHAMAANASPAVTVSTMKVGYADWQPQLKAAASLRATMGVDVTTEMAGMVQTIVFEPGADVKKDDLLVQLNIDPEVAQLHSLEASAWIAKTTYTRDKAQYAVQAVSKATLDADEGNFKSAAAQVEQQKAVIAKKTIRAPFSGRLGVSAINPGQYLNPGDKIAPLQAMDPIYADFYLPQQALIQLRVGQKVLLSLDSFPNRTFYGKITTIDPVVSVSTRNVQVEATFTNSKFDLVPGMFATAVVQVGEPKRYLTVPQTAISFNPYGDVVFVVKDLDDGKKKKKSKKKENPNLVVEQRFVTTGETRGDQITVLKGLKEGDVVVTSGQVKLKNGSKIIVNNSVEPANNPAPVVSDE